MSRKESSELQAQLRAARAKWRFVGAGRPEFAESPQAGQESVWDYPRPPDAVADARLVVVSAAIAGADVEVARSSRGVRVRETASPPTFYLPPADVRLDLLEPVPGRSICEWKGVAESLALRGSNQAVAWRYPEPFDGFTDLAGWIAFYAGRIQCVVAGEVVQPQPGGYYGGWMTSEIVGPVKGLPGTESW